MFTDKKLEALPFIAGWKPSSIKLHPMVTYAFALLRIRKNMSKLVD
jgi:hypothetical protein